MPEGLISGREYTSARPGGFAPWNPSGETLELIAQVREVLEEYRSMLPMTARQRSQHIVLCGIRGKFRLS
jgi:hypothetical protein